MRATIENALRQSAEVKEAVASSQTLLAQIEKAVVAFQQTVQRGGTIVSCGNGGSACDAMHFTEELLARYKKVRPGIKARHLLDSGVITCWANDYDFETIFERQVDTLCGPQDLLVLISTSGNSKNVINAAHAARRTGTTTIGLLGNDGGDLAKLCDLPLIVPSSDTERIQEVHITLIHIFCQALEAKF